MRNFVVFSSGLFSFVPTPSASKGCPLVQLLADGVLGEESGQETRGLEGSKGVRAVIFRRGEDLTLCLCC